VRLEKHNACMNLCLALILAEKRWLVFYGVLRGERDLWRRAPKAEYSTTEAPIPLEWNHLKLLLPPSRDFGAPNAPFKIQTNLI